MTASEKIQAIQDFIDWREERNDASALHVSLALYEDHLVATERKDLAQQGLDALATIPLNRADESALEQIRKALAASL